MDLSNYRSTVGTCGQLPSEEGRQPHEAPAEVDDTFSPLPPPPTPHTPTPNPAPQPVSFPYKKKLCGPVKVLLKTTDFILVEAVVVVLQSWEKYYQ